MKEYHKIREEVYKIALESGFREDDAIRIAEASLPLLGSSLEGIPNYGFERFKNLARAGRGEMSERARDFCRRVLEICEG